MTRLPLLSAEQNSVYCAKNRCAVIRTFAYTNTNLDACSCASTYRATPSQCKLASSEGITATGDSQWHAGTHVTYQHLSLIWTSQSVPWPRWILEPPLHLTYFGIIHLPGSVRTKTPQGKNEEHQANDVALASFYAKLKLTSLWHAIHG